MKETVDFSKLIADALDGNEKAFSELYRLTQKTAYHTASVLLSNPDDIEDVLQNAYSKAFDKLSELKSSESFEGWVKSIVENECRNFIKKEKKFSAPLLFFKNKVEENAEEWKQPVPQEYMERQELRKSVADIIDSLSPEVRACIVLFHYEDKSLNEISEILDIPLGTVKSRLHNGRRQIEKEFNKLRKKDPTLFGIGAIPVILSLLSYQAKNITVPAGLAESVLSSAIGSAASAGAASSAGAVSGAAAASGTAGASSAAAGASSVAASIAVKVTAVAVAGSVAVGGSVAIKKYVESKASNAEATTISAQYEETCTVEELITETPSVSVSGGELSSANQTSRITSQAHSVTPTVITSTTAPQSRTTTQTQTTTAVNTTARKPTTTKATTVAKTTAAPTTSPENNYGASNGVITEFRGSDTNVSIPSSIGSETVNAIGAGAFAGNSRIKSVSLPSTVNQIGQEAFADCTSLTSVSLPSSLRHIGIGAFYGCTKLSSVSIPDGAETIGDEAFAQCTSLKTVTIPSSVTSISADAFDGCESLTVRCEEGSFAHSFAVENGLDYNLI